MGVYFSWIVFLLLPAAAGVVIGMLVYNRQKELGAFDPVMAAVMSESGSITTEELRQQLMIGDDNFVSVRRRWLTRGWIRLDTQSLINTPTKRFVYSLTLAGEEMISKRFGIQPVPTNNLIDFSSRRKVS